MRPLTPSPSKSPAASDPGPLGAAPGEAAANAPGPSLAWYLRLRWLALAGHAAGLIAAWSYGFALHLPAVCGILAVELVSALALSAYAPQRRPAAGRWLVGLMLLDAVLLMALLYLTGGPHNPMSVVIMVNVALAAVLLRPRAAAAVTAFTLGLSVLLFVDSHDLVGRGEHGHHHGMSMELHLYGMWAGYGVAGVVIIGFIARLRAQLAAAAEALGRSRESAARVAQQARLATVTAGAAHELATPLASIAVAATELAHALPDGSEERADALTIREQVARCRAVLDKMSVNVGDARAGERHRATVAELVGAACARAQSPRVACEIAPDVAERALVLHGELFVQALHNLVDNALRASPGTVTLRAAAATNGGVEFTVRDEGEGIAPEHLDRVGEPFFTTRTVGEGMGLGVFVARSVAEQMGGALQIESRPGEGTTVALRVPGAAAPR